MSWAALPACLSARPWGLSSCAAPPWAASPPFPCPPARPPAWPTHTCHQISIRLDLDQGVVDEWFGKGYQ